MDWEFLTIVLYAGIVLVAAAAAVSIGFVRLFAFLKDRRKRKVAQAGSVEALKKHQEAPGGGSNKV